MALTLDSSFLRKLERFEIIPHGLHRGGQIGHRRSPSRGTGLEFADHKEYSAGDDIRYIDWNVYAHLEELFIKIFEQEEALPTYVLLDRSASMSVGTPTKLLFGAQLAAALAYVGLANQDHVRVSLFANGLVSSSKVLRGKTHIYEVFEMLDAPPEGTTDISSALESFSTESRLPGVAFIISDFLDPAGVLRGIRLLAGRKFGVYAVHLVAKEELFPGLSGDVEFQDVETLAKLRVPLRKDTIQRFGEFFEAHCEQLRAELRRYGVRYIRLGVDRSLDEVLFTRLPKEGVLK
ncbi:MAG: DUF58 domain-containing protein [Phycisphaerae bacterium]